MPPVFSALKVDGRRAYDLARAGEAVELKPRRVLIERLEFVGRPDRDHADFVVGCGKGTYIRSLARDLGERLGVGAHLESFGVDPAVVTELDWGESAEFEAFRRTPLYGILTSDRAISDTIAALICHGVFDRHPRLRVATIESGSEWVHPLIKKLAKAHSMTPGAFSVDPVERLRANVWVAPYYEDDIRHLADAIGSEHVLFGSDWPHAEGLADPKSFVDDLQGFSDDEIHQIMRTNAEALSVPPS